MNLNGDGLTGGIHMPTSNDVLCGRGAGVNNHAGNINFRAMVKDKQSEYVAAITNIQKYLIVMDVLQQIKNLNPPGRFISQDTKTGLWHDVEDEKARRKIGQALRENVSALKKDNDDKDMRTSLLYTNRTDYKQDKTYRDMRNAIENELTKNDSLLRKQLLASLGNKQQSLGLSELQSDMVLSMDLTLSDMDKILTEYRSNGSRRQLELNESMIDIDTVGTFSVNDMSLEISSSEFDSDELGELKICFKMDMV